jgi:hypothetical protein
MQFSRNLPVFQRDYLPSSSGKGSCMAVSENRDVRDKFRRHKHGLNRQFAALTLYRNNTCYEQIKQEPANTQIQYLSCNNTIYQVVSNPFPFGLGILLLEI